MRFSLKFITALTGAALAFGVPFYMSARRGAGAVAAVPFSALTAKPDPLTALFTGREVSPPHSDASVLGQLKLSPVNREYQGIHPERALLISNCQVASQWCKKLDVVQFAKTLRVMAAIPKNPSADTMIGKWVADFAKEDGVGPYIGAQHDVPHVLNSFQLLAVVNRMDVACFADRAARAKSCDSPGIPGKWTEAELRFVYGLRPSDANFEPHMTIILEFVLPSFDVPCFRGLAQRWKDLPAVTDGSFPDKLSNLLEATHYRESVSGRIRLNYDIQRSWRFLEWDFPDLKNAPGDPNPKLEDQVNSDYMSPDNKAYLALWTNNVQAAQERILIPESLLGGDGTYQSDILRPPDSGHAYPITRNVLALQQCRYCHTDESNTLFVHIQNRQPNDNSQLSGFLLGTQKYASVIPQLPTIEQLYAQPEPKPILTVKIPCDVYQGPGCTSGPITRRYHDLARRGLFLATVLASDNPRVHSNLLKLVNTFATDLPD